MLSIQRVLDLDLDFFIHGLASMVRFDGPRLDADQYPPRKMADVMAFLEERCHLLAALPGRAVEHHGDVFTLWRRGLLAGDLVAPFHVTHIDAHADLGMGENGYWHLLTQQLHLPPAERWYPRVSTDALERAMTDGSYLAFAVGCRWISDLTICPGGGDIHPYIMEGWDPRSGTIRMPRLDDTELRGLIQAWAKPTFPEDRLEPPVPLTLISRDDFFAPEPFDFIFLARSPAFTPAEADPIYDAVRERFIDEEAFSPPAG